MTLEEIRYKLSPHLEILNEKILKELTSGSPLMDKVVGTYLRTSGKQLRPLVLMICAKLFGPINDNVIAAASSVEILHNASLIHDDIVDDTDMRRCRPTINSLWDSHVAVLVGDFFVSTAMQQAISTGNIRIIDALCHLGKLLSMGEIDQVYNTDIKSFSYDSYYSIIKYKTASLFVASARMGCYAQGLDADDPRVEKLAEFAELLGLCFQIKDDIFDYLSNDEVIGKPTGNDLKEGKITLPLIYALSTLNNHERDRIVNDITDESLTNERIGEIIKFAIDAQGVEFAFKEMERLKVKAFDLVSSFGDNDNISMLKDIFNFTISRQF